MSNPGIALLRYIRLQACWLVLLSAPMASALPGDENWEGLSFEQPVNHGVLRSMAVFKDNLYAVGWFWRAGDTWMTNTARWDGTNWTPFLEEFDAWNTSVHSLAAGEEHLYIYGFFFKHGWSSISNLVLSWNGTNYSVLPDISIRYIGAIAASGTNLYVGGYFDNAGTVQSNYIARWDGAQWHALGTGTDGVVNQITTRGNEVFVGGLFTTAGGISATNIARWDGRNWTALGDGTGAYGWPSILHATDSGLFVAGQFSSAGGQAITNFARWDGTNWHPMGGHDQLVINTLHSFNGDLYVGGRFTSLGGVPVVNFAQWDGTNWSAGGISGGEADVQAIVSNGDLLYAGGSFSRAGDLRVNSVACWDGLQWRGLGNGVVIPSGFGALAILGTNLYAAGSFFEIGGVAASNIARWNGTNWTTLGLGADDQVNAAVVLSNRLYVGGAFLNVDAMPARHVARWNGSSWSALGPGVDFPVAAMAVFKNSVAAAGRGSGQTNSVARWNGSRWVNLISVNGKVSIQNISALASTSTHLFALGPYSIFSWNGTNWSDIGAYLGGARAIATYRNRLYAAGSFYDGALAEWTGSNWIFFAPIDTPLITSLAVMNDDFYVTSYGFPTDPGPPYRTVGVARWDGLEWSYLGSSVNGSALRLLKHGDDMYVGGWFTQAGGKPATFLAIWHDPSPKAELRIGKTSDNSVVVSWPKAMSNYVLQRKSSGSAWTQVGATPSVVGSRRVVTNSTSASSRLYRLKKQ